jgi:hypothetical protein
MPLKLDELRKGMSVTISKGPDYTISQIVHNSCGGAIELVDEKETTKEYTQLNGLPFKIQAINFPYILLLPYKNDSVPNRQIIVLDIRRNPQLIKINRSYINAFAKKQKKPQETAVQGDNFIMVDRRGDC